MPSTRTWIVEIGLRAPHAIRTSKQRGSQRVGLATSIHGPALWLQQAVAKRSITVEKQAAATVSPDIGTKAWDTHSEDATPTSPFGCTHDVGLVMVLRSGKTTLHRSAPWIRTCMTRKANQLHFRARRLSGENRSGHMAFSYDSA